jgi:3-deoxy-manno-octulosonate cytidylyltransferase (CMP-KDO synthetase)
MIEQQNTIVVIPARLAAKHLPGKPLADIGGLPMIVHVWRRAVEAKIGHVLVAAADLGIAEAVKKAGGDAMMTEPNLPSGTDRVAAALSLRDPQARYTYVVSLPDDLPTIDPLSLQRCLAGLTNEQVDVATIAAPMPEETDASHNRAVNVVVPLGKDREVAFARDFLRQAEHSPEAARWLHIGIYAYRREALKKYAALPVSPREKERGLEQMRALDNGMRMAVVRVDGVPLRVDSPQQLDAARRALKA